MKFTLYHSCITVLDLDKSMKFYEEAFGFKEVRRISSDDGSYEIVFMAKEGDETMLELTWYRDRTEPYDLEAHAHHEKMGCICFENPKMGIYFVADPDGYWMEVVPTR